MNNNFNKFSLNTESKLKDFLKKGELKEFSDNLSSFYPTAIKFFTADTEEVLNKNCIPKLISKVKKNSLDLMTKYKSYDVQADKIVLEKHDLSKEEYPIISVIDFMKNGLNIKEENPAFFLIASYLISPINYDFIQIFGVYLLKT